MTKEVGTKPIPPKYSDNFPEGYGDFAFQSNDGDMYELGKNATNEGILTLGENAKTLDFLLRLIDPTKEPPPLIWTLVKDVIEAGDKYQINGMLGWFQRGVEMEAHQDGVIDDPLLCLELADRYKLPDV
ncbi:11472_t:CDS:2, partial [Acaulospora colombiana]